MVQVTSAAALSAFAIGASSLAASSDAEGMSFSYGEAYTVEENVQLAAPTQATVVDKDLARIERFAKLAAEATAAAREAAQAEERTTGAASSR